MARIKKRSSPKVRLRFYSILLMAALCAASPAMALREVSIRKPDEAPPVKTQNKEQDIAYNTIVLRGLNKVTGSTSRLESPVGVVTRFGTLEIVARRCWKSPPDEQPENAGLLEVYELKPGEAPEKIFLGWMFSSSPGLSSLEHAVYDITVMSCESKDLTDKQ